MWKRIYNFFVQPYTNVWYCIGYHYTWKEDPLHQIIPAAIKDAWRTSDHDYLMGCER